MNKTSFRIKQLSDLTGIPVEKLYQYDAGEDVLITQEKEELHKAKKELNIKKVNVALVLVFFLSCVLILIGMLCFIAIGLITYTNLVLFNLSYLAIVGIVVAVASIIAYLIINIKK